LGRPKEAGLIEIRFHGRGGQGSVIASNILASAAFKEGKFAQSFPLFGGERRGAPVAAFTRIDDQSILLRCEIYEPDHVVVLDPGLINHVDVTAGLKRNGWILVNTDRKPSDLGIPTHFSVATVDATSIAVKHRLGTRETPIVNSAVLGAFVKITNIVCMEALTEAIAEEVPVKKQENVTAAQEAYNLVQMSPGE
jgi:2-oxoacid:acceptor oxidoreductase gamma subunit (pyruvate/2-ketoisovalerate family)